MRFLRAAMQDKIVAARQPGVPVFGVEGQS
jgi:hypothetical protein